MQSFWFDNRTGVVYMTQAPTKFKLYAKSRLKPNGEYI
ncbi:hypothetical protein ABLV98_00420 [Staphylococcus sp. 50Mo3-1]